MEDWSTVTRPLSPRPMGTESERKLCPHPSCEEVKEALMKQQSVIQINELTFNIKLRGDFSLGDGNRNSVTFSCMLYDREKKEYQFFYQYVDQSQSSPLRHQSVMLTVPLTSFLFTEFKLLEDPSLDINPQSYPTGNTDRSHRKGTSFPCCYF
jgi:hypothetical protein